jgi:hypothetical protein
MKKIISSVVILSLLLPILGIFSPSKAIAASVTTATDTLSRLAVSATSDHTIMFVTPTGVASTQNITLTFSAGFTGIGSMVGADFDFAINSGGTCTSGSWTEQAVVTSGATSSQWNIAGSSQVVTITSGGASATVTAGRCIRLKAGLNATDTTGSGPGSHQITNPGTVQTATVTIAGSFGDSGIISIPTMDSDQVNVTATVNSALSFDIDVGTATGDNNTPYSVPLGTLSSGTVTHSDNSSIKSIYLDGTTNSSGGLNVSVRNANGANGLVSSSNASDKIPSATASMSAGTANYGLCVATSTLTGWSKSGTYTTTCATNSSTNGVVALSSTAADILTSSAPLSNGHAEVVVNATIATTTPGHSDYTDTLTFIATSSF